MASSARCVVRDTIVTLLCPRRQRFKIQAQVSTGAAPSEALGARATASSPCRQGYTRMLRQALLAATVSGLALLTAGAAYILSLSGRVPSLQVESATGRYAPRFYIRGLGNVDFDFTASQPVSVVLDDVVLESVYLKGFPLFDVQQLEVLRGPQGTLFGRNTPAGVIKIDTVKPSDEFTGFGSLTYGNLGSTRTEAAVTLPASETLQVRGAFLWNHRDDWVNNAYNPSFADANGDDLGGFDDVAARVHAAWQPTHRPPP